MQGAAKGISVFKPEMIEKMAYIWTRSSISLQDVRQRSIDPEQPLRNYTMPGSMLVYVYGGNGSVQLDERVFALERFGLFHGGKGSVLGITAEAAKLDSYLVIYKAQAASVFKRDLQRLLDQVNPFVQQFGYVPSNPLGLLQLFGQMMEDWQRMTALGQMHARSLFDQAMFGIYRDLEQEGATFLQTDPVASAKRYLDQHYRKPILFKELAEQFAISGGQLTRLFKKREGMSLQEYAIAKRLEEAKRHLAHTNANVREIADGCGFADEGNFFRMFKKQCHMTPLDYRKIKRQFTQEYTIDNDYHDVYNERGLDHPVETQRDGAFTMLGQARSKQMMMAAAVSLMMLLSACTTSGTTVNNGASQSNNQSTVQEQQESAKTVQTRIVSTVMGDVEVSTNPQRIVSESYWVGDILALGKVPVAIERFYTGQDLYADKLTDTVFIDTMEPEDIMSFDPDLIITRHEEDFEKFNKVAPTVVLPWDMADHDRMVLLAQALGQEVVDGEQVLAAYDQFIEENRKKLDDAGLLGKTISMMHQGDSGIMIHLKAWTGTPIYEELGMKMPEAVKELGEKNPAYGGIEVSYEVLPVYNADLMLVVDKGNYQVLADNEIWKAVPAVAEGRLAVISEEHMFFTDLITKKAKIEKLVQAMLEVGKQ